MSARQEDSLETPVRIGRPVTSKRPWRTTASPEDAARAQVLIRMAVSKG